LHDDSPLPPSLTLDQIVKTVEYIEERVNTKDNMFYDVYLEQASALSAVISVFGNAGLDKVSPYKRNPNRFRAQDRFPDLMLQDHTLEGKAVKGFNTPNAHTPHGGWHIIWHYWCDPTRAITNGKFIAVVQVDVADLKSGKWDRKRDPNHSSGGDWNEGRRRRVTLDDGSTEDAETGHSHNYTLNRFGLAKLREGTVYSLPTFEKDNRKLVAASTPRTIQRRF
jgi:hypothetical protein